ncbi:hypothetical protein C5H23_07835 [Xylella fastidiosa]|nr:hypothetical protein [Xylella fastidiosa subsp. multiplex]TNV88877.1 hypothetical protein C5H23_07835 [Xylella fastidiosa]
MVYRSRHLLQPPRIQATPHLAVHRYVVANHCGTFAGAHQNGTASVHGSTDTSCRVWMRCWHDSEQRFDDKRGDADNTHAKHPLK